MINAAWKEAITKYINQFIFKLLLKIMKQVVFFDNHFEVTLILRKKKLNYYYFGARDGNLDYYFTWTGIK